MAIEIYYYYNDDSSKNSRKDFAFLKKMAETKASEWYGATLRKDIKDSDIDNIERVIHEYLGDDGTILFYNIDNTIIEEDFEWALSEEEREYQFRLEKAYRIWSGYPDSGEGNFTFWEDIDEEEDKFSFKLKGWLKKIETTPYNGDEGSIPDFPNPIEGKNETLDWWIEVFGPGGYELFLENQ